MKKKRTIGIILLLSFVMVFTSFAAVFAEEGDTEPVDPCAGGHTWAAWTTVTAPTYFATGQKQRTCTVCGTVETASVAKLVGKSKWVKKGDKYYYFDKNGKLISGWHKLHLYGKKSNPVKWCYFKSGKYIKSVSKNTKSKWVTASGKKFYFTSSKKPAGQGYHTIGSKVYYMGSDKAVKIGTFKDSDGNTVKTRKDGSLLDGYAYSKYVLIDISDQTLKLYKNHKLKLSAKVVTGMKGVNDTPTGIFRIQGKTRNTRLVGPSWNVGVSYWMPFYAGNGIHDATWRPSSQFNKNTYKYNGSHGCVNMKYSDAQKLYKNVSVGTRVVIRK